MTYTVSGIDLRISEGKKFPGDLRVDAWTKGAWRPVEMSLAFFLVDFFTENERERQAHVSFWRQNGDRYFLNKCVQAVRDGWSSVATEIDRQRRGAA